MVAVIALAFVVRSPIGAVTDRVGASVAAAIPPDVLAWRGWGYLNGAKGVAKDAIVSAYSVPVTGTTPKSATPIVWRERIFVFAQTEREIADTYGVVHADRHGMESVARKNVDDAIAQLGEMIASETGGRVQFSPEVTVEGETMRAPTFGPAFAQAYVGPRINGGGYEADDKVFRGPYNGAALILPGPPGDASKTTWVNGTPVRLVTEYGVGAYAPGDLTTRLHQAWLAEVGDRLAERLVSLDAGASVGDAWTEATTTADLPTDVLLTRIQTPPHAALFAASKQVGALSGLQVSPTPSDLSVSTEVSLIPDPDHGQVLEVSEKGVDRNGAFLLPVRADGKPLAAVADTPTLSFDVKSTSHDPIGIIVSGPNGALQFSLGRQWATEGETEPTQVAFANTGAWQHIALDLRGLVKAADGGQVTEIAIAPTLAAIRSGRVQTDPIRTDLDNIKFTSEAPTPPLAAPQPDSTSTDPEDRALFAAKAKASSSGLIGLLADKSELVRLNACRAYARLKDNNAQPNLIADVVDLDPAVAEAAIVGLNNQGGPIAAETLRRTVRLGITPLARATAARLLGETKDPGLGEDIVSLIVDPDPLCRLASVQALTGIPGKAAAIQRMAFLSQEDPDIKVAVTRSADPTDEYEMRKLLWSAVNEPSDLVRADADIQLIQATDPQFQAEGYKGVRDDSPTTRLIVLDFLTHHPKEANRTALRLAVADHLAAVRAAALSAFAALDKGATTDEVANVMDDRDPGVQLALITLSKKSGWNLSDQTRQMMAASPDPRVKQALGGG